MGWNLFVFTDNNKCKVCPANDDQDYDPVKGYATLLPCDLAALLPC